MLTKDVTAHFGGIQQTADALGIKYQSVREWGDYPPYGRQCEIQLKTNGVLVAESPTKPVDSSPEQAPA